MIGNASVMIYYMCLHVYLLAYAGFLVAEWQYVRILHFSNSYPQQNKGGHINGEHLTPTNSSCF